MTPKDLLHASRFRSEAFLVADVVALERTFDDLDTQERTNWCWAAASIGTAKYKKSLVVNNQCRLVEIVKKFQDCQDPACNEPGNVKEALKEQKLTAVDHEGAPAFPDLVTRIGNDQPVICNVKKEPTNPNSLPHSVVIYRCVRTGEMIDIKDPATDAPARYIGYWQGRWELSTIVADFMFHFFLAP